MSRNCAIFVDVVYDGVCLTVTHQPSAFFHQRQAQSVGGPMTYPRQVTDMRFIYNITQGTPGPYTLT